MDKKKNVILISDQGGGCIDSLLDTQLFNIKLVIVPYKKNADELKKKYNGLIEDFIWAIPDTNSEFQDMNESYYDLTYDDIEKYRNSQFKCYRYNTRFITDDNTNNNIYYTSLRFFLGFFNNNKIDCVISRLVEHGSVADSLIFDIAKNNNIPVYIFSLSAGFDSNILYTLLDYNNKNFVDLSSIDKSIPNIDEYLSTLNKNYSNNRILTFPFSKLINKLIHKKNKSFFECIKWLYLYRIKFYYNYFKKWLINDLFKIREETSFSQIIKGNQYHSKLKKYYRKKSFYISDNENFIFFPLHLEPEASTMVRATLSCQLFLIEQIAKVLPNGWYLYIKEHPEQFNTVQFNKYFHKSVANFRNIDFYKRVSEIDNVKLIKISVPSSVLINKSKAVTSIAGSSLIESVVKKKPVIVWGNGCTFIELLEEVFTIRKLSDLENAINRIKNGYNPQYDDFSDIIKKYVISVNYKNFYEVNCTISELFRLVYRDSN